MAKKKKKALVQEPKPQATAAVVIDLQDDKFWYVVADLALAQAGVKPRNEWNRNEFAVRIRTDVETWAGEWNTISSKVEDSPKSKFTVKSSTTIDRSQVPTIISVSVRGSEMIVNRTEQHQVDDPKQMLLMDREAREAADANASKFPAEDGAAVASGEPEDGPEPQGDPEPSDDESA